MHPSNDTEVFSTPPTLGTDVVGGVPVKRLCEPWIETRHFLLQVAHFCFTAAFVVPSIRRQAAQFLVRLLLTVGFLSAGLWAALRSCTGPDVLAWNAILLVTNCAQAAYVAYRNLPPRIAPEFQELYLKVFYPLKVGKDNFYQLIRYAHVEPLEIGEHYAMEGVTFTDQRLAILLSGKMKVTCEEILLHYLLPTEFVDSPEWESCDANTDKRFQVTLTAIEPCQLLCWGRKELLTILENNQFLNVVMYNLIGKDITHKLYSLNDQHRKDPQQDKLSITESLEFWRSPMPRSHSVDMVHTQGNRGHVRSLFWKKPEKQGRRTSAILAEHLGDSRTSNFSDPGPRQDKKGVKQQQPHQDPSQFVTPV